MLCVGVSCVSTEYPQGERLYQHYCAGCHASDGSGLLALYPPLTESESIATDANRIPCAIRYGLSDTLTRDGVQFSTPMEALPSINDVEIANIYNYMAEQWYPQLPPLTDKDVRLALSSCTLGD